MKLVVTYGIRTKKIMMDSNQQQLEDITKEIKEKFLISSGGCRLNFQYLDKEINEWIDLDRYEDLNKDEWNKIRVTTQDQNQDAPEIIFIEDISPKKEKVMDIDLPLPSLVNYTRHKEACKAETMKGSTVHMIKQESPDEIPSSSGYSYPTSDKYNQIIDSLFREYPHLAQGEGMALQSARDLWKERLLNTFQNSRKRKDHSIPEIIANKRKKEKSSEFHKSGQKLWGLANYLPDCPLTEDETSTKNHIEWLKREFKKKEGQDKDKVDSLMNLTLHYRRRLVVTEQKDVESILFEFPWLKSVGELLKEFLRLGPSIEVSDLISAFRTRLDIYSQAIINLSKTKKGGEQVREIIERTVVMRSEEEREAAKRCAALIGLPLLLREKIGSLLVKKDDEESSEEPLKVKISMEKDILSQEEGSFILSAENVIICTTKSLDVAVLSMLLGIYAFNLAYPKPIEKTLMFLQRVIINFNDELAVDKRLLSTISSLNKEIAQQ